jgi:hypothetical protein
MLEYPGKTVTPDIMAWVPTELWNEWAWYGTNDSLRAMPHFPVAGLYLREARVGWKTGTAKARIDLPHKTSNVPIGWWKQSESLFIRVRGV